jgi:dTDP-4-amino-4,6-dideoxygalactose transaminase
MVTQERDVLDAAIGVPRFELSADLAEIWPTVERQLQAASAAGEFILGPAVTAFEQAFAAFQGVGHVVGVGSGTDALELALRASGVSSGDEVIVPANSFNASAAAVVRLGAIPVVVDCDDDHLLIDPEAAAAATGPRTRAVMPVHLYGQMAPMADLVELGARSGIVVVEDCAQAHGARQGDAAAGSVGLAGGTSFHPHKNLAAWGDAGAVLTDDSDVAARVRRLRQYGGDDRRVHVEVGWNSRLDTVQAIVLLARLDRLAAGNRARAEAAAYYGDGIRALGLPVRVPATAPGNASTWHLYVIRVEGRDAVAETMRSHGIGVSVDYRTPLHLQPAFEGLGRGRGSCPVAECAATEILSLPLYPSITRSQQDRVIDSLAAAVA